MKETIRLSSPLEVNGKKIKELKYDIMEINSEMFAKASALADDSARQNGAVTMTPMEMDSKLHLFLGFMAVIAVDSSIDVTDLMRLKGFDVIKLTRVGRNFITTSSEEESQQSNSEEQSEAIPESSTQE